MPSAQEVRASSHALPARGEAIVAKGHDPNIAEWLEQTFAEPSRQLYLGVSIPHTRCGRSVLETKDGRCDYRC